MRNAVGVEPVDAGEPCRQRRALVGGDHRRRDRPAEVGVHEHHGAARLGERGGQVDGHGRLPLGGARRGHEDGADAVVVGQRLTAGGHERDGGPQRPEGLGDRVVLIGPDDEPRRPLLAVEGRQLAHHRRAERLFGLAPIAQLGVQALEQEGEGGAEERPDGGRDRHPRRPGPRGGEAAGLFLDGLGPLERRQVEVDDVVGEQCSVAPRTRRCTRGWRRRVGRSGSNRPGPADRPRRARALRSASWSATCWSSTLDLAFQAIDVLLGPGLALLADLLLPLGEVANGLVGEGVGDAHRVVGVVGFGGEAERARLLVVLDGHSGGQARRGRPGSRDPRRRSAAPRPESRTREAART